MSLLQVEAEEEAAEDGEQVKVVKPKAKRAKKSKLVAAALSGEEDAQVTDWAPWTAVTDLRKRSRKPTVHGVQLLGCAFIECSSIARFALPDAYLHYLHSTRHKSKPSIASALMPRRTRRVRVRTRLQRRHEPQARARARGAGAGGLRQRQRRQRPTRLPTTVTRRSGAGMQKHRPP
jgi:hypothetical protein